MQNRFPAGLTPLKRQPLLSDGFFALHAVTIPAENLLCCLFRQHLAGTSANDLIIGNAGQGFVLEIEPGIAKIIACDNVNDKNRMADAIVNGFQKVILFQKILCFLAHSQMGYRQGVCLDNTPWRIGDGYAMRI